jgi:ssDNA thymidine ADP-ribosyltransferase, DarT
MPRPQPTPVFHITRFEHLESMVAHGLLSDNQAQERGLVQVEIGNVGIKAQRVRRLVPIAPGGVVADYVPFYFAPRSPMLYAIDKGNVPTYQQGCEEIIYLVSSTQTLAAHGLTVLGTDRNAVMAVAEYTDDDTHLTEIVDWNLMKTRMWNNTSTAPDRRERRQAELLVLGQVPWSAFLEVGTKSQGMKRRVEEVLARLAQTTEVAVRRDWYF